MRQSVTIFGVPVAAIQHKIPGFNGDSSGVMTRILLLLE